jgi:hypothetical protein
LETFFYKKIELTGCILLCLRDLVAFLVVDVSQDLLPEVGVDTWLCYPGKDAAWDPGWLSVDWPARWQFAFESLESSFGQLVGEL